MNISKFENGNVVIPLRTTKNNDVEYCMVQQTGVQLFVEGNYVKLLQNGVLIGYILTSDISETQLLPAAPVSFDGTSLQLFSILADEFFILSTDLAGVQAEVDALQVDVAALQNEWTYLEVDIPSSAAGSIVYSDGRPNAVGGVLGMGTSPIELLPTPGAGNYYEYEGSVEYTFNTTAYTSVDNWGIIGSSSYAGSYFRSSLDLFLNDRIYQFNSKNPVYLDATNTDVIYASGFEKNESIVLTTYNGGDPTLGDGTIKVKIKYKVVTFG